MATLKLYKYRAVNEWSLQTIRSTQMWFSLPAKLNDTFEFSVPVFISMSPRELVEHYEKRFAIDYVAPKLLELMTKHGDSNSFPASDEFVQAFLINGNEEDRSLYAIAMIHFLKKQGLTSEQIAKRTKLDSDNELSKRLETELRESYYRNQSIGFEFGVLSLSARHDNPQMWAHYGDSCKGICIGVNFEVDRLLDDPGLIPIWVKYAEELPLLDPAKFFDRTGKNRLEMLKTFYGTKHEAWFHEAEFRLLSRRGEISLTIPGQITEVILGEKIERGAVEQVVAAVESGGQD
ncbi:DUF2971 domain-containing protein [Bradyrhizobium sp. Arg237L]|uniref:DUF2971 domain-containing protein n=1 Tax=Bradyrhizobium sp. Arg237L TaxID=3003352 RepID=UPI00249D95BC|nr:DUF2971 domain-containing protein [Bradyrhizobium sp. Arg237L]MDI4232504.1 DUF2971 domain-containing protein [Bradyrhizobium sp. Arg237L]